MKMKDNEQLIFTPGLSSQSLKMDYFKIDNMTVVGQVGSGKDTLINFIVKSMIDSNPTGKLSFVYLDYCARGRTPLSNPNRITSYNQLMKEVNVDKYLLSTRELLTKLSFIPEDERVLSKGTADGVIVVVINEFDVLPSCLQTLIKAIIKRHSKCECLKFILSVHGAGMLLDILDYIPYRLVTRTTEDGSNSLMRCNIACRCADKYGSCWFYDVNNPDVYNKYKVKFIPESLLNRMMKVYAKGADIENKLVSLYYDVADKKTECELDCRVSELIHSVVSDSVECRELYTSYKKEEDADSAAI